MPAEVIMTIVLSPETENVFLAMVAVQTALQEDPENEYMLIAAQRLERAIGDYASTDDKS